MTTNNTAGSSHESVDYVDSDLEPGACSESALNAADAFDELAAGEDSGAGGGTITAIQSEIMGAPPAPDPEPEPVDVDKLSASVSGTSLDAVENETKDSVNEERTQASELASKEKHVFIFSSAGKPIYSRHGSEDKLAGLCGVMQALVSVVEGGGRDSLRSVTAAGCRVVFLARGPLVLVAVSKGGDSESQLMLQLNYAFNQIVSVLTLTQLTRIFEQRRNYDLRRLLSGAERLIDHLLVFTERDPAFLLGAVRCLPLPAAVRETVTSSIVSACAKIRDLVFAILIAGNQLITLVRMKKYTLHPADIHLLFNLVRSSESFKTAESWTPICLPKFDATGFLHAHVSYISEECPACLLLLTVQRDAFFPLSQARGSIAERLRRQGCLAPINDALARRADLPTSDPLRHIGIPELRHFMYKCKFTAQLFTSDVQPVETLRDFRRRRGDDVPTERRPITKMADIDYLNKYRSFYSRVHCASTPAKLIFRSNSDETILAWVTNGFELYATLDPLMQKNATIVAVDRLLRWIKKEEDRIFIMHAPTF